VGLAVLGLAIGAHLTFAKLTGSQAALCTAGGGCDIVQSSRYATLLGVPTALWGAVAYAVIGALALMGLTAWRWLGAFLVAVASAAFSLYLTYVSLFVVHATCIWCLASLTILLVLVGVLVAIRPAPGRRTAMLRPARVGTLAVLAAVVAVGGGAATFESDPAIAAPYATAVARHLTQSGALMYGAYW
jgi:uncharacterized membrane protein